MVLNTLSKVADTAIMELYLKDSTRPKDLEDSKEEYTRDLQPHQLGVEVKFAVELLTISIRMILHVTPRSILINIDLKNAYNAMWRATVLRGIIPT